MTPEPLKAEAVALFRFGHGSIPDLACGRCTSNARHGLNTILTLNADVSTRVIAVHDSRAVANEILKIAWDEGISLTPMQIIKLVYFAHGWSLGLRNRKLFNHEVRAWQYGPVIREVYWAFNKFGRAPIGDLAKDEFSNLVEEDFDQSERRLLRSIVKGYGKLHAFELSDMTHEPDTPWSESYRPGERALIDNRRIHKYFRGLAQGR